MKVRGSDLTAAYTELLALIKSTQPDIAGQPDLTEHFRNQELSFSVTYETITDTTTLNELALKYYRDKRYGALIRWMNPGVVPDTLAATSPLPIGASLGVPHFNP